MRREAPRTLLSLSRNYQQFANNIKYEVIAIDNGSSEPLDEKMVSQFGKDFRYIYLNTHTKSPCKALNHGVETANGKLVMLCIDGARILSPGILFYSLLAAKTFENPFVYTIGMHLGNKLQNYLVEENYSQTDEDKLLASVNWEKDGYQLFDVSSIAGSSKKGYLSDIMESNCVALLKSTYHKMGGYDENFSSPGGGLANLDFFNRANQNDTIDTVMLLGEATFHQMHGGIATNVALKNHPWESMTKEYQAIRGKPFQSYFKPPVYLGKIHQRCRHLFQESE